jgi:hypothetical protein
MPRQYDTLTGKWEPYDPDANVTMPHGTENDGKALATDIFDWLFERAPKAISRKLVQMETVRTEG